MHQKGTDDQEDKLVWQVISALRFRDLKIKQVVPNISLRLSNIQSFSAKKGVSSTLALLHEGGFVSFWTQDSW